MHTTTTTRGIPAPTDAASHDVFLHPRKPEGEVVRKTKDAAFCKAALRENVGWFLESSAQRSVVIERTGQAVPMDDALPPAVSPGSPAGGRVAADLPRAADNAPEAAATRSRVSPVRRGTPGPLVSSPRPKTCCSAHALAPCRPQRAWQQQSDGSRPEAKPEAAPHSPQRRSIDLPAMPGPFPFHSPRVSPSSGRRVPHAALAPQLESRPRSSGRAAVRPGVLK